MSKTEDVLNASKNKSVVGLAAQKKMNLDPNYIPESESEFFQLKPNASVQEFDNFKKASDEKRINDYYTDKLSAAQSRFDDPEFGVSDDALDTPIGAITNTVLSGTLVGGTRLGGMLFSAPGALANYTTTHDINNTEREAFKTARSKLASNEQISKQYNELAEDDPKREEIRKGFEPLTEVEESLFVDDGSMTGNKYIRLLNAEAREEIVSNGVDEAVENVRKAFVNQKGVNKLNDQALADFAVAKEDFAAGYDKYEKGDTAAGIVQIGEGLFKSAVGLKDAIADNPAAVATVFAESVPQMIAANVAAIPTATVMAVDLADKAQKGFVKVNGRNPEKGEVGTILAASTIGAYLELLGAKGTVGAGAGILEKPLKAAAKQAVTAPIKGGAKEFATEATQGTLEEYAVKQDVGDLNFDNAYLGSIVGLAGGAGMSAAVTTPAAIGEGLEAAASKLEERAETNRERTTTEKLDTAVTKLDGSLSEAEDNTPKQNTVINVVKGHVSTLKEAVAGKDPEAIGQAAYDLFTAVNDTQAAAANDPELDKVVEQLTADSGYLAAIEEHLKPTTESKETLREVLAKSKPVDAEGNAVAVMDLAKEDVGKVSFLLNQALYSTRLEDDSGFTVDEMEQITELAEALPETAKGRVAELRNYVSYKAAEDVLNDVAYGVANTEKGAYKFEGFTSKLESLRDSIKADDTEASTKAHEDIIRFAETRQVRKDAYDTARAIANETGKSTIVEDQYQLGSNGKVDKSTPLIAHPSSRDKSKRSLGDILATDLEIANKSLEAADAIVEKYTNYKEAIQRPTPAQEVIAEPADANVEVAPTVVDTANSIQENVPTAEEGMEAIAKEKNRKELEAAAVTEEVTVSETPETVKAEPVENIEVAESVVVPETSKVTLTGSGRAPKGFLEKDQAKSDKANKFIGHGRAGSSTEAYAQDWGNQANTGEYTSTDTVFVSINGGKQNPFTRESATALEVDKAIAAGATIIADDFASRNRSYNKTGELRLAKYLTSKGYRERDNGSGVWTKANNTTAIESQQELFPSDPKDQAAQAISDSLANLSDVKPEDTAIQREAIAQLSGQQELDLEAADKTVLDTLQTSTQSAEEVAAANGISLPKAKLQTENLIKNVFESKPKSAVAKVRNLISKLAEATSQASLDDLLTDAGITDEVSVGDRNLLTTSLPAFRDTAKVHLQRALKAAQAAVKDPKYNYKVPLLGFITQTGELAQELVDSIAIVGMNLIAYDTVRMQIKTDNELKSTLGLDTNEDLDPAARGLIGDAGTPANVLIQELGNQVIAALGIRMKASAAVNYGNAIRDTLGQEVIDYLVKTNMLQLNKVDAKAFTELAGNEYIPEVRLVKGVEVVNEFAYVPFYGVPKNLTALHESTKASGESSSQLTKLLVDPQAPKTAISFAPVTAQADTFIRSTQKVSNRAKSANTIAQAVAHRASGAAFHVMNALSKESFLKMFGHEETEGRQANIVKAIQGKNLQLERSYDQLRSLEQRITEKGSTIEEQDLYFSYSFTQNYRQMVNNDVSWQGDKLVRAFVNTESTVRPKNRKDARFVKLALAQGLDIDIGKMSNTRAIREVNKLLKKDVFRDAIADLQGYLADDNDLDTELLARAIKEGKAAEHTFQVLIEYARFLNATEPYQTSMYIEIDGVTNGPFNAMVQMGNDSLDINDLDKLRKAGLMAGTTVEKVSYNDERQHDSLMDSYNTVGSMASERYGEILEELTDKAADPDTSPKAKKFLTWQLNTVQPALDTFLSSSLQEDGSYSRNAPKQRVTVTTYGGSRAGLDTKAVKDIVSTIYKKLDKVLQELNTNPSAKLEADAIVLMANLSDLIARKVELSGNPTVAADQLKAFTLTKEDISKIEGAYGLLHAKALGEATDLYFGNMATVKDAMVQSSNIVSGMYNQAFMGMRDSLRAKLIKAGKLDSTQDLSREQYDALQARLIDSAPVYEMMFSAKGDKTTYWSGAEIKYDKISDRIRSGMYSAKTLVGSSIASRGPVFGSIGVRVVPMLTISNDAAMQILKLLMDPSTKDGNVYDAFLAKPSTVANSSKIGNLAAYTALKDYDQVQAVADTFTSAMKNNPLFTAKGVSDTKKGMLLVKGLVNIDTLPDFSQEGTGEAELISSLAKKSPSLRNILGMFKSLGGAETLTNAADEDFLDVSFAEIARMLPALESNLQAYASKATARKQALLTMDSSFNQMAAISDGGLKIENGKPLETVGKNSEYVGRIESGETGIEAYNNRPPAKILNPATVGSKEFFTGFLGSRSSLGVALQEIFIKNMDFVKTVGFKELPAQEATQHKGSYDPGTNTVSLAPDLKGKERFQVTTHELIHAILANAISRFATKDKTLTGSSLAGVKTIQDIMLRIRQDPVALGILALRVAITAYNSGDINKGLQELAAYGLSEASAIKYLREQPTVTRSFIARLTGKLLAAISTILGRDVKPSMLTDLAEAVYAVESAEGIKGNVLYSTRTLQFNAVDIFSRTQGNVSPRLRNVLQTIQERVLGKLDNLPAQVKNIDNVDDQLFLDSITPKVLDSNNDFFIADFNLTDHESLVFKLYAEVIHDALQNNYHDAGGVQALYAAARKQLKGVLPSDQYKVLFEGQDARLHLANFAALSAVSEEFQDVLDTVTVRPGKVDSKDIMDHVEYYIGNVLNAVADRITGAKGKPTDRLQTLANRLVHIKAKRTNVLENTEGMVNNLYDKSDDILKTGVSRITKAIRGSHFVTERVNKQFLESVDTIIQNPDLAHTGYVTLAAETFSKGKPFNTALSFINEITGGDTNYKATTKLKREKTHAVDASSQAIRTKVPKVIESLFVTPLTSDVAGAITKVFSQADLGSLLNYGISEDEIIGLVNNPGKVTALINTLEANIGTMVPSTEIVNFMLNQAEYLGRTMATGAVYLSTQLPNAKAISEAVGMKLRVEPEMSKQLLPMVDALASLYALSAQDPKLGETLKNTLQEEANNPNGNALGYIMRKQNALKEKEVAGIAGEGGYAQMKGFTYDIMDPNRDYKLIPAKDVSKYIKKGYSIGEKVYRDTADITAEPMVQVYNAEGGNVGWLQGTITLIDTTIAGANPFTGKQSRQIAPAYGYSKEMMQVRKRKQMQLPGLYNTRIKGAEAGNHLMPMISPVGEVSGYRYMVPHGAKDKYLQRNNEIGNVLGHWEARITEESTGKAYNEIVVKALNDRYKNASGAERATFVTLSAKSSDPAMREMYRLLPLGVKRLQKVFHISAAEYDNVIGYRKHSVTDLWETENGAAKVAVRVVETVLGKGAANILRKGERGLQELVSFVKDMIVVKSVIVPTINLLSNVMQLHLRGVPLMDIIRDTREGFTAATAYKKIKGEIIRQEQIYLQSQDPAVAKHILQLKEVLRTNPVNNAAEAGMMPSIVEGLDQFDDLFSMKDGLIEKVSKVTSKLPKTVRDLGKQAMITQDSKTYGLLNEATELGDFVAKYTLMKHAIRKEGMSEAAAMDHASRSFIDYGALPSKKLQYLNDTGMFHFFKYFMRIQPMLVDLIVRNPSKVLMFMASGGYGIGAPAPLDAGLPGVDLGYKTGLLDLLKGLFAHPISLVN